MKNMIKAELFKFSHSPVLWIIISILTAASGISIITGTFNSVQTTISSVYQDSIVIILALAIYAPAILTDDFSNGLLRHYIVGGYKRFSIICAKFIHYLLGSVILLFVYPLICVLLTAVIYGVEQSFLEIVQTMLLFFIKSLTLYLGILGLFFFISISTKKGVAAMGASIAISVIITVFTNAFYEKIPEILKYSPIISLNELTSNNDKEYLISSIISILIMLICFWGSFIKFKEDDAL